MPKENLKDRVDGNEIDLSMSSLDTVPVKELAALPKVTSVDLSCNLLTRLPDDFCSLEHIIRLDLSKNNLTELPSDFGLLENIQHLDLLGNSLTTLPRSFCQLKKLKWLDLKDNPLESGLLKNAGDCLDEVQCKRCATRILMYMTDLDAQLDAQWQNKMQKKKEEEAKLKAKEDKEKRRQQAKKKAEKEKRRKELENKRNQERLAQSDDTSDEELKAQTENTKGNLNTSRNVQESGRGNFVLFVLFTLFILGIALLAAFDFHCQTTDVKDPKCHEYWHPIRSRVVAVIASYEAMLTELYTKQIAPLINKYIKS